MERTEVFEMKKQVISAEHIETFTRLFRKKVQSIGSEVRGWTRWEQNGRIYIGWKRTCCYPLVSVYTKYRYKPLSTIEIIRRKVRVWLDKK